VDFADTVPAEGVAQASKPAPRNAANDWWIFTALVDRWKAGSSSPRPLSAASSSFDKDPILLDATGGVVARTRSTDDRSGKLKSRARISGPDMVVDLRKKFMRVEGRGNLLIEDYARKPRRSDRPSSGQRGERVSPFGRLSTDEPSQTFIAWERSMNYRYELNVADFAGEVAVIHRTGAKMKLADQILGAELVAAAGDEGREATLNSESIIVKFLRSSQDRSAGAGRLSGNEVDAFNASGQVHFSDGPISAIANQITYARSDNVLQILGSDSYPAQLFDEKKRFRSLTGPRFDWDRNTNRILAPRSRGRMN
jgi:hypothetical protein